MRAAAGLALLALTVAGCGDSSRIAPASQSPSDPGAQPWERVPRDQVAAVCGLDPDLLEAAEPELAATPYTIVRYGRLCWAGGYPTGTSMTYPVWSETKTFGAILFGMVASRSSLDDTDPVTEWIPAGELGTINPAATLAHVLAMTSTSPDLAYGKKNPWSYDTTGDREINTLVGVMNRAIANEPGAFPGVTNAKEFAEQELFAPLGMTQTTWPGEVIGSSLESTVEDMSRLALLLLRQGRWDGRQLLDEAFVYRITHPAFEDANTGYGYLTQMNAEQNWTYSTGTADLACAPYTTWPGYPHAPLFESPDDNGGSPFDGGHDIGVFWAAGTGGQKVSVHRGLDLVIGVRDDAVDTGGDPAAGEGAFEGHKRVWRLIRPALVALDPVYAGDETAFCDAYQRSAHARRWSVPGRRQRRGRAKAQMNARGGKERGLLAAGATAIAGLLAGCGGSDLPAQDSAPTAERCPRSAITRLADKDYSSPRWQRPMMNYQLAGCDINGQVPGAPGNEPWWDTMDFWIYEAPGASTNPDPMLVLYLHGTSQTPIDAALGIGWNELADRERIVVLYPHGLDGENNNWTWGETTAFGRVGQLESVSQITMAAQALLGIGPERTFIAGASSGAISATMVAALYPDLFSGVMSVIGGSYNLSDPDGSQAYAAMGDQAKVMPAFLIHATADHLFPQTASREADTQWAGTNDRADNGVADGSISQMAEVDDTHADLDPQKEPAADECATRANNNPCPSYTLGYETYPYEIHRYRDEFGAGRTIVEAWYLQFMAHNYPYGNPEGNFTDPAGPDVTTAGYLFFRDILANRE